MMNLTNAPPKKSMIVTSSELRLKGSKFVVVSNLRIGGKLPSEESIKKFHTALNQVIVKENPSDIVIVGQIVDPSISEHDKILNCFLDSFYTVEKPVHIICSTSEKPYITSLSKREIDIIMEYCATVKKTIDQKEITFFITDDMGNKYDLSKYADIKFAVWLKQNYMSQVSTTDWIITGHTKTAFIDNGVNVASPGNFDFESGNLSYILFNTKEMSMTVKSDIFYEPKVEKQQMSLPGAKARASSSSKTSGCAIA